MWVDSSFLLRGLSLIASRSPVRWLIGARGLWRTDSKTRLESAEACGDEGARWRSETRLRRIYHLIYSSAASAPGTRYTWQSLNHEVPCFLFFFGPRGEGAILFLAALHQTTFRPATMNKPFINDPLLTGILSYCNLVIYLGKSVDDHIIVFSFMYLFF